MSIFFVDDVDWGVVLFIIFLLRVHHFSLLIKESSLADGSCTLQCFNLFLEHLMYLATALRCILDLEKWE